MEVSEALVISTRGTHNLILLDFFSVGLGHFFFQ